MKGVLKQLIADKISFDVVPFVIIGRQVLECCYGKARKHTSNVVTSTVCLFEM